MKMSDKFENSLEAKFSNHEIHEGRNLFPGIYDRMKANRKRKIIRNFISGIAASILLLVGIYFGFNSENIEPINTTTYAQTDHEPADLIAADQESLNDINGILADDINEEVVSNIQNTETVLKGEYRGQTLVLPDQTKITLEKGALLSYNSQFGIKNRKITFSGTGYFEVYPDQGNMFIIETPNSLTKVVGTSFNLASSTEIPDCIAVTSGVVEFGDKGSPSTERLEKGQTASLNHGEVVVNYYSDTNFLSWKTGSMVFESTALKDIIPVMSEYFGKEIKLQSAALENCIFSGQFESPNLNDFLEIVSLSLDIEYKTKDNQIVFSGIGCNKD